MKTSSLNISLDITEEKWKDKLKGYPILLDINNVKSTPIGYWWFPLWLLAMAKHFIKNEGGWNSLVNRIVNWFFPPITGIRSNLRRT